MVNLGDKVKDQVTGFTGIVIAKTIWLYGCDRVSVQPQDLDKDGKVKESQTFDEKQLILVKAGVVKTEAKIESTKRTGGPRNDKIALRVNTTKK